MVHKEFLICAKCECGLSYFDHEKGTIICSDCGEIMADVVLRGAWWGHAGEEAGKFTKAGE